MSTPASSWRQVCPASSLGFFSFRENVLVLDIFFEALNYEAVEQKAAYEVSELLGVYGVPGSAEVWTGQVPELS